MDSCGRILCDQLSGILLIRRKSCGSQVRAMYVRTTIQMDCIDRHGSFGILYSSKLNSILQGFGLSMWCFNKHPAHTDSASNIVSTSLPFESGRSFANRIYFVHDCRLDRRSRLNQCRQTNEGTILMQLTNVIYQSISYHINLGISDQFHHLLPHPLLTSACMSFVGF